MIKITKACKFNKKELKLGIAIEHEHSKSRRVATRIAKQHLCEFPHYYTKGLIPMEKRLWKVRHKVWAQKNDDSTLGGDERAERSARTYNIRL